MFHHYHPAPSRPVIRLDDNSPTDSARMSVHTVPGIDVDIQHSTNLRDWALWRTVRMGREPIQLPDALPTGGGTEFYRAVVR
jgi:hypothetical protein